MIYIMYVVFLHESLSQWLMLMPFLYWSSLDTIFGFNTLHESVSNFNANSTISSAITPGCFLVGTPLVPTWVTMSTDLGFPLLLVFYCWLSLGFHALFLCREILWQCHHQGWILLFYSWFSVLFCLWLWCFVEHHNSCHCSLLPVLQLL